MFGGGANAGGGFMGALSGAMGTAGPIGMAVSGIMAMISPLLNIKRKQRRESRH